MLPLRGVRRLAPVALLFAAAAAVAQEPQQQPDVAILANVRAKELRFTEVPDVKVTFPDQPRNQTVWKSDRTNLPDQVQPYVTYRDIGIRLTITSTLPNIEEILDDALGPQQPATGERQHVENRSDAPHPAARKRTAHRAAAPVTAAADDHKSESRRSKHVD